jgi:hypothetical protein
MVQLVVCLFDEDVESILRLPIRTLHSVLQLADVSQALADLLVENLGLRAGQIHLPSWPEV